MKYIVSWTLRNNGTRIDGNGGFSVKEADDVGGLAHDLAVFAPYLDFTVYPVQEQSVGVLQEAVAFRDSV